MLCDSLLNRFSCKDFQLDNWFKCR